MDNFFDKSILAEGEWAQYMVTISGVPEDADHTLGLSVSVQPVGAETHRSPLKVIPMTFAIAEYIEGAIKTVLGEKLGERMQQFVDKLKEMENVEVPTEFSDFIENMGKTDDQDGGS